jgi:hypothetical protein
LRWRRGIVLCWTAASAGSGGATSPRPGARTNSSSSSGPCATSAGSTGTGARTLHRAGRRHCRTEHGRDRLLLSRLRRWRSDFRHWRRSDDRSCIRGCCLERDILKPFSRREVAGTGRSTTPTRRTRTSAAYCGIGFESSLRRRINNEKKNQRMSKKRGSGSLPPPLSLARYSNRRPISPFYVDGAGSFGDTPMTFTPAPRATSIAKITSAYLTFGSPFTKMIFSGRPS